MGLLYKSDLEAGVDQHDGKGDRKENANARHALASNNNI
jgi:hypothetical protein